MKRILILSIILIGFASGTYAQSGNSVPKFSAGGTLGVIASQQSSDFPLAVTLFAKYERPINKSGLSVAFILGISSYISGGGYKYSSDDFYSYSSLSGESFIPIEIGIKYYLTKGLFIEGDGGVSIPFTSGIGIAPIVSPYIGYTIPFGHTKFSLDLGLGYETRVATGKEFSQVAGHLAFNIGL